MSSPENSRLLYGGLTLAALSLAVAALSPRLGYGADWGSWPVPALVALLVSAGALYVWLIRQGGAPSSEGRLILVIVLVGAIMRIAMLFSTPMLEDDFYRYLWDGAVVAHGYNPYSLPPEAILATGDPASRAPETLRLLAGQAGPIFQRINHPYLTTIYPPVAQAAFALAYLLAPFSVTAWRLVLLGFDLATLGLVWAIIRTLSFPVPLVAVYWWNPLLVKVTFNSGHMDILALPLALAAVLLTLKGRLWWALVFLSLAVGAKLWPLILLPLLVRPWMNKPGYLFSALIFFSLGLLAIFFPVYSAGEGALSGFLAYSQRWEMNDALFKLLNGGVQLVVSMLGYPALTPQKITRLLVALLLAAWVGWLSRRPWEDGRELGQRCLLAVAALFLLSPAQFPWYFVMLVPFLAVQPRPSLLLLTALLPLYYLRFYFLAKGQVSLFDHGLVFLQYLPVWALILWEWRTGYQPTVAAPLEGSVR